MKGMSVDVLEAFLDRREGGGAGGREEREVGLVGGKGRGGGGGRKGGGEGRWEEGRGKDKLGRRMRDGGTYMNGGRWGGTRETGQGRQRGVPRCEM